MKRFDYREGATYPDRGTRYQTFSNEDMLEMETVGELVALAPGASATLSESWELFGNVPDIANEAEADRVLGAIPAFAPNAGLRAGAMLMV